MDDLPPPPASHATYERLRSIDSNIAKLLNVAYLIATLLAVSLFTGCASNTGIVPAGSGAYMIAKQASTGFPGLGNLKGEALTEADAYCANQGKQMEVISATETQPPFILGKYPRAEVNFRCTAR